MCGVTSANGRPRLTWRSVLMTHSLCVSGNIKLPQKPSTLPLMTFRGYEDITSNDVEFSLPPLGKQVCVVGTNTDGEPPVRLHQTRYESVVSM